VCRLLGGFTLFIHDVVSSVQVILGQFLFIIVIRASSFFLFRGGFVLSHCIYTPHEKLKLGSSLVAGYLLVAFIPFLYVRTIGWEYKKKKKKKIFSFFCAFCCFVRAYHSSLF
jgi:hypothetical protein